MALRLPLIGSVARDEAALLCRGEACLLARANSTHFWMVRRETPRKFCMRLPAKAIALYFYGTDLGQCEGFVSERVGHTFHLFLHEMR